MWANLVQADRRRRPIAFGKLAMAAAVVALPVFGQAAWAQSERADWQSEVYPYVIVESDVRSILTDFGRNTGTVVSFSDDVNGEVRGDLPEGTALEFLDRVTRDQDLVWYYDGFVVDISTRSELRTEVLDATGVSASRLESEIKELEIYDPRFEIRGSEQTGLIFVFGPPRYVELVQQTLNRMREIATRPVEIVRGNSGPGNGTGIVQDLALSAGAAQ